MEPGFGGVPVPHHGVRRNLQCFRGFFHAEACKESQFDDLTLSRIERGQSSQRFIDLDKF